MESIRNVERPSLREKRDPDSSGRAVRGSDERRRGRWEYRGRDPQCRPRGVAQLRRRHATDSAYVHLAGRLGTLLWTLDAALARNAADIGLPVELLI